MQPVRRVEELWGTVISVDVRDPIDPRVVDACFAWFRRVDDLFSTWRADTEIMRIAHGDLRAEDASREVGEVLALCDQVRVESGGAFDISFGAGVADVLARPGGAALDPSGLVKGWAVARAGDLLADAGASCFFLNAGGDVLTRGRPADSAGWRVGIQHPWERSRVAAVLLVTDLAVATSGLYERGEHVLDPRTGQPARDLASATVVGPDLALADAYATAVVVLGAAEGLRWLTTRAGYEGMAITDSRSVLLTPEFDRYRVS